MLTFNLCKENIPLYFDCPVPVTICACSWKQFECSILFFLWVWILNFFENIVYCDSIVFYLECMQICGVFDNNLLCVVNFSGFLKTCIWWNVNCCQNLNINEYWDNFFYGVKFLQIYSVLKNGFLFKWHISLNVSN